MRADLTNLCFIPGSLARLPYAPNSLFRNILPLKRLDSRCCGDAPSCLPGSVKNEYFREQSHNVGRDQHQNRPFSRR